MLSAQALFKEYSSKLRGMLKLKVISSLYDIFLIFPLAHRGGMAELSQALDLVCCNEQVRIRYLTYFFLVDFFLFR